MEIAYPIVILVCALSWVFLTWLALIFKERDKP